VIADSIQAIGPDLIRLLAIILGMVLGYGAGRYLWTSRHLGLAPFPIIAAVAAIGLLSSRIFAAMDLSDVWQNVFFPWVVGFGAGFSVTSARPPRQSPWWQVWRS
jgi:hypothetical protein